MVGIFPVEPVSEVLTYTSGDNDMIILPMDSLNNGDLESGVEALDSNMLLEDSGFDADISHVSTASEENKRTRNDTPIEKIGRKRKLHTERWKQNVRKKALNSGEEHVSAKGKVKVAREMEEPCNLSCRSKCREKITEDERKEIFQDFWNLGKLSDGHDRQWYFIRSCMTVEKDPAKSKSKRTYAFRVKNKAIKICKTMFLATLSICDKWIETVVKKLKDGGVVSPDKRGLNRKGVKIVPPGIIDSVVDHINSFPRVESHYVRKDSTKEYLQEDVKTVARMYDLYKEWLAEEFQSNRRPAHKPATERQYRDTFNEKFNLGFFLPKKDQCDECNAYKNASDEEKINLQDKYNEHISNKTIAQEMKKQDATLAKEKENKDSLCVAAFDY